jgi:hypothetical protein
MDCYLHRRRDPEDSSKECFKDLCGGSRSLLAVLCAGSCDYYYDNDYDHYYWGRRHDYDYYYDHYCCVLDDYYDYYNVLDYFVHFNNDHDHYDYCFDCGDVCGQGRDVCSVV